MNKENIELVDARGGWTPSKLEYKPLFSWPPKPIELIKWLFNYPDGFIFPWAVIHFFIALISYIFFLPSFEKLSTFSLDWIAIIFQNLEKFGSPLKRIVVNPNGEISLKTYDFELIHLGTSSSSLNEQIKALQQLSKKLPPSFIRKTGTILDLRDPSKPEFQIKEARTNIKT